MHRRLVILLAAASGLAIAASTIALAQPVRAAEAPAPAVTPAAAPAPLAPMTAAERKTVVESLAKQLEDYFVFPDVAAKYAAMLRANLGAGAYDGLSDPTAFAVKVTADLQAVSKDGHLRLATNEFWAKPPTARGTGPAEPFGLVDAHMIGDVAYLKFTGFPEDAAEAGRVRKFLTEHAEAKAVVIDSRTNHGGSLMIIDTMAALLFPEQTVMVRMDTRAAAAAQGGMEESPTLLKRDAPAALDRHDHVAIPDKVERRLQHVPVYYLTSSHTGSAAEHLALAFKHTHRATLIGETTHGAGHYGGVLPVGERFGAFMPVGRTYDPDTNWDWEGVGVTPDVAVPADQALDEALKRAKAAGA